MASIRTDTPIVLEIDARKAREDGIRIVKANDQIALAEEIPAKYIKRQIIFNNYSSS